MKIAKIMRQHRTLYLPLLLAKPFFISLFISLFLSPAFAANVTVEVRTIEEKGEMHLAIYDDASITVSGDMKLIINL